MVALVIGSVVIIGSVVVRGAVVANVAVVATPQRQGHADLIKLPIKSSAHCTRITAPHIGSVSTQVVVVVAIVVIVFVVSMVAVVGTVVSDATSKQRLDTLSNVQANDFRHARIDCDAHSYDVDVGVTVNVVAVEVVVNGVDSVGGATLHTPVSSSYWHK
jgi:hypothetical protein